MSDRKLILLAAATGGLALAANVTVAVITITTSPQPVAIAFGAIGLAAALISLVTITRWGCLDRASPPFRRARRDNEKRRRARVFTPWSESVHGSEAMAIEPREDYADEEEELVLEEIEPVPTRAGGATIVYLTDWQRAHERHRAHA